MMATLLKRIGAALLMIPVALCLLISGWLALATLITQVLSQWLDIVHFNLLNFFNPFTSLGGSGTWIDSLVAGQGAAGGSAARYLSYLVYGVICAVALEALKKLMKVFKSE
jgi:hypothetical protein